MIPDHVFSDLIKDKNVPDSLTAHLKLQRKFAKSLKKRRNFADALPGVVERYIYDLKNGPIDNLPGQLVRVEGQDPLVDETANEAYDNHGLVRDFLKECLFRSSFDGAGADIHGTVHVEKGFDNAFFTSIDNGTGASGHIMCYGDGLIFQRFTKSLDVAAHEIGHGVVETTANLWYWSAPGANNESMADVLGICCKHWARKQTIKDGNWLIGDDIVTEQFPGKAIRSFKNEKAYSSDSQPKHNKNYSWTLEDNQGVHINSGIPNHAFYNFCLNCTELGIDYSFNEPLQIWYKALLLLKPWSGFKDLKKATLKVAKSAYPLLVPALEQAWKSVGL